MDFKKKARQPLLRRVNKVLRLGLFAPPLETVIKENEILIGELNDREKAIYTVMTEIADKNNALVEKKTAKDWLPADERFFKKNKKYFDLLTRYFWNHIRRRIGKSAKKLNGLGMRAGYMVVAFSDRYEAAILCILRAMGHDCDNCKIYETCELLQKKPKKKDEDQE